jgi:VWFA-related protein
MTAAVLFVVLALAPQPEPPIPAFPARADAILVDVVVVDADGRPVRGLSRDDFTLFEDGRPQAIVGFEALQATGAPPPTPRPPSPADSGAPATTEEAPPGRTLALVLDDLGIAPVRMAEVHEAITGWLQRMADPQDDVTLVSTSGDLWWSDRAGEGKADLLAVLARARGKRQVETAFEYMSEWEAYRIAVYEDATGAASASSFGSGPGRLLDRVVGRWMASGGCAASDCRRPVQARAREIHDRSSRRARAVLGTVERLSRGLAGARGRKTIVVLSEGFIRDTHLEAVDRAVDASQRGNTAVYFVDTRGLTGPGLYGADQMVAPPPGDVGLIGMEQVFLATAGAEYVAEATGGTTVRDTNDLLGGLQRVADESSAYYLLGYQPEKSPDGKWHKLEVKVARPGVEVRARRGYHAGPPAADSAARTAALDATRKEAPARALDPALLTSVGSDALEVRVAPYVIEPDEDGLARVLVAVEVDTAPLTRGATAGRRTALDLTVVGVSRDQPKTAVLDQRLDLKLDPAATESWLTLSREIRLPAGVSQVRVLVRDLGTGKTGRAWSRFEVAPLDRPFLSTPVLTNRMERRKGAPPRLVPVARRQFPARGSLFCQYQAHGFTDAQGRVSVQVAGGYTLQSLSGRVIAAAAPTPIAIALDGRLVRMLAFPLEGLPDGEYELTLEVVDQAAGRRLVVRELFRIAG